LQSSALGWASRLDLQNEQAKSCRVHRLDCDTQAARRSAAAPDEAFDNVAGNGQRHAVRDHRIDPDHTALCVGQRTTGIPRRELHIGLNPSAVRGGVYHAKRHSAGVPVRASNGQHELARAQRIGIPDRCGRQVARIGFEESEIESWVARRYSGFSHSAIGKPNAPVRPADNVGIRHDEPARAPDHTRTAAAPRTADMYRGAPHSFGYLIQIRN
jgi:hypothetical protein